MKIGILGSGGVAQTLGAGLARHGHAVMLGSSAPARLADWVAAQPSAQPSTQPSAQPSTQPSAQPGAQAGSFADAARFGELLILAVKGTAAAAVLEAAGRDALAGKVVIDACNPIADAPPVDGVFAYFTGPNDSLMERLQAAHPAARFVKAFNSVGTPMMVDPQVAGGRPTMFIAGNDVAAKDEVAALAAEIGWECADMGRATAARAIEPLAMLWCIPGLLHNQWTHVFRLVQRS